jgi:hypothetical protein
MLFRKKYMQEQTKYVKPNLQRNFHIGTWIPLTVCEIEKLMDSLRLLVRWIFPNTEKATTPTVLIQNLQM